MQSENNRSSKGDNPDSTIEEITKLAPLTQAWFMAVSRQYGAGKSMLWAEWNLVKRSLLSTLFLALFFTAFLTVLIAVTNVFIGYAMSYYSVHWAIIGVTLLALNLIAVVICFKAIKRIGSHIHFRTSIRILKGANEQIHTEQSND